MDVFPGGRIAEVVTLRLDRGEDVVGSIEKAARDHGVHTGIVISGIGTLDQATLHHITTTTYPSENEFPTFEGPIELLSIDGIIADFKAHLHTCISIKDETFMGHMEPGCRVLYLAEIAIAKLDGVELTRTENPETGINELHAAG
jgi:predicted DNA-binding protein with PD1-like motif